VSEQICVSLFANMSSSWILYVFLVKDQAGMHDTRFVAGKKN